MELLYQRVRHGGSLILRRDSKFVSRYLKGLQGIEIGASASNNFFLDTINVDRWGATDTVYKQQERRIVIHACKVDVVAVVPHKERMFDRDRPLSTVEELLERHRTGFSSDEDRHWSVWTRESFVAMCEAAGLRVIDSLDPDDKIGDGFIVVLDAVVSARAARGPSAS